MKSILCRFAKLPQESGSLQVCYVSTGIWEPLQVGAAGQINWRFVKLQGSLGTSANRSNWRSQSCGGSLSCQVSLGVSADDGNSRISRAWRFVKLPRETGSLCKGKACRFVKPVKRIWSPPQLVAAEQGFGRSSNRQGNLGAAKGNLVAVEQVKGLKASQAA